MQLWHFFIPLGLGVLAFTIKRVFQYYSKTTGCKDRRQYEFHSAERMKNNGFRNVRVTQGSQDNGRDVEGWKGKQLRLGQCKMYGGKKKVGVKEVRELYGVAQAKSARAIFFTTNGYTKAAIAFARQGLVTERILN